MARRGLSRWSESLCQTIGQEAVADSDHDLLLSYRKQHDPEAFRKLVTRYAVLVENACRQVLRDPADIEDTFQATFLVLWKKSHTLDGTKPIGAWLFGVAHRLAVRCKVDRARRQSRESESARQRAETEAPNPSWIEVSDFLHRELDSLADKYRQPLLLCAVQGLTRDEAATELGVSLEAIRWRLEKGRELLQQRLTKRGLTLSAGWFTLFMAGSQATDVPSLALITSTLGSLHGPVSSSVASLVQGAFPMFKVQSVIASVVLSLTLLGTGLGFLSATPQEKPTPKPEKPIAEKAPAPPETRPLTVTVLGVDGQPLAGAKLEWHMADKPPQPLGETDATGSFQARVPQKASGYVIARFGDLGLDYLGCTEKSTEAKLKLRKDVPIRGQLKHKDGKPVVGAKVKLLEMWDYGDNTIQPLLDSLLQRTDPEERVPDAIKGMNHPGQYNPTKASVIVNTDDEGRFVIRNLGGERLVVLEIEGDKIARSHLHVVTRAGFDPRPFEEVIQKIKIKYGHTRLSDHDYPLRPSDFSMVCEPEKIVEGIVRDSKSQQPLAGIKLYLPRESVWFDVTSDSEGKFQIRGAHKSSSYILATESNLDLGYVASVVDSPDNNTPGPIKIDVPCTKGIVITGTLKDKKSGLPLEGYLSTRLMKGNPALKNPWLKHYELDFSQSGTDGKYRILTLPGLTLLNVEITGPEAGEIKPVQPDPDYPELFKIEQGEFVHEMGKDIRAGLLKNGCKVIDAKESDQSLTYDFAFERGAKATVNVLDSDAKPLTGTRVRGHHAEVGSYDTLQLEDRSEFSVYNVEAGAKRYVFARHREKKLVGLLKVDGSPKQTLTLGKGVTFRGRVLDNEGKPLAGCTIAVRFLDKQIDSLIVTENDQRSPTTKTNEEGIFAFENIVPGVKIDFIHALGQGTILKSGAEKHSTRQLLGNKVSGRKHGDFVDLGDGVVEVEKRK
ncbi:MAG: sigma-70 family RNA polymerase sigma factor [Fimbriiglobus sp.]